MAGFMDRDDWYNAPRLPIKNNISQVLPLITLAAVNMDLRVDKVAQMTYASMEIHIRGQMNSDDTEPVKTRAFCEYLESYGYEVFDWNEAEVSGDLILSIRVKPAAMDEFKRYNQKPIKSKAEKLVTNRNLRKVVAEQTEVAYQIADQKLDEYRTKLIREMDIINRAELDDDRPEKNMNLEDEDEEVELTCLDEEEAALDPYQGHIDAGIVSQDSSWRDDWVRQWEKENPAVMSEVTRQEAIEAAITASLMRLFNSN